MIQQPTSLKVLAAQSKPTMHPTATMLTGLLYGRPEDSSVHKVRKMLDDAHIAYGFNVNVRAPRPRFVARGWTSYGEDEIRQHIAVLCAYRISAS